MASMSPLKEKLNRASGNIDRALHSSRGKDVMLYLMFVAIAFVFWLLLSLDNEVQRDFDVPVEIVDVPDSVTIIDPAPKTLSVSVKSKGSQLLRFLWGHVPVMKIKYDESRASRNRFFMNRSRLEARLRDYFGNVGVQIVSCKPDSISLAYTESPGRKVRLEIKADVQPNLQCIISGPITANVDSVRVYSAGELPKGFDRVETEMIVKGGLKDTMRYEVKLKPVPGARLIPDKVIVTVPVEPLISRKRQVEISAVNVPDGVGLITFPSKVDVSFLVPMSIYGEDFPMKAYVDYDRIRPGSSYLPVALSLVPEVYHNISLSPDSVEYIIEHKKVEE